MISFFFIALFLILYINFDTHLCLKLLIEKCINIIGTIMNLSHVKELLFLHLKQQKL